MRDIRKWQSVRRLVLGGAFTVTLAAGVLLGGLLTSQEAEAQPTVGFSADAGLIFHFIKPTAQADYEGMMGRLRDALQRSEVPGRQDQARGWKVFKATQNTLTGAGSVAYVWVVDPAVAGAEYSASTIMNEAFPSEIEQLYNTYNDAFTDGPNKILQMHLELVSDF